MLKRATHPLLLKRIVEPRRSVQDLTVPGRREELPLGESVGVEYQEEDNDEISINRFAG